MSGFTPGPWYVDTDELMRDDSYAITTGENVTGDCIANVRPVVDDDTLAYGVDEQQANARLIAAAPDLFRACKAMLALMERFEWYVTGAHNTMADARAAIGKVERAEASEAV